MIDDEIPGTAEELLETIHRLCQQWESYTRDDKPDMVLVGHHRGDAVSIAVHGLSNETTLCAGAARSLLLKDYPSIVIMPLVRQALECAFTAQWLVQVPDAADMWAYTDVANTRKRQRHLRETGNPDYIEIADQLETTRLANIPAKPHGLLDASFFQILEDLAINHSAVYTYFATLSSFSHATTDVVDAHRIGERDDGSTILTVRPTKPDPVAWLYLAAGSLVWAHTAASYTSPTHPIAASLAETADQLRVEQHLKASASALQREAKRRKRAERIARRNAREQQTTDPPPV